MATVTAPSRDLGEGVLFDRKDCASTWRRLAAFVIDGGIYAAFSMFMAVWSWFVFGDEVGAWIWLLTCFVGGLGYFVVLKRSLPTLGFWIAGIRVRSLDGGLPGYWPMFLRFGIAGLWALTGSLMAIVDLLWISGDEQRQSLRDKIAGTVVVRRGATPVAQGRQTLRLCMFVGFAMYLREVKPVAAPRVEPVRLAASA